MPDSQDINNPFLSVDTKTAKTAAQDGFKFDPSTAKPAVTPEIEKAEKFNFDPSTAKKTDRGISGHVKDFGLSLASGVNAAVDSVVGIGDMYTGGHLGKAIDDSGVYKAGEGSKYWNDKKSAQSKVVDQAFQDADGITGKAKVALSNPSKIVNAVGESIPAMLASGAIGRAAGAATGGIIAPVAAGAIGEGAIMAGGQASQIRQQTHDGLLTPEQSGIAAATGIAGGLLGYVGGRIASRMGVADIDTTLAGGALNAGVRESAEKAAQQIKLREIPKAMVFGAISEGLLEELPQSVSEQVLQNIALEKPWHEGLDDAIVMGTLAGMAMGGTVSGYGKAKEYAAQSANSQNPPEDAFDGGNLLPAPTGGSGGEGLTGEYIPAQDVQPTQSAYQNFEYDQMPMDADNRLNSQNGNASFSLAPSQQMGINPEDGPLSAAAATAVDSGMSAQMQIEMQAQEAAEQTQQTESNVPLQSAADAARELASEQTNGAPNTYSPEVISALETSRQSQQGKQNEPVTTNESAQNEAAQRGSAQIDDGGQPLSEKQNTKQNDFTPTPEPSLRGVTRNEPNATTSFQTQPLDHGALNVPLSKRGNIDAQLDQYKKEQATLENEKHEINKGNHTDAQSIAKPMFETLSVEQIKIYANKAGIRLSEAKKELKSMAHWQPKKAVKVFEALTAVQSEQDKSKTPAIALSIVPVQEIQKLEQQLVDAKSVSQKARLRKQIAELQKYNPIDQAAHEAATSIQNDLPAPTQAQIEAGNYKKGHIKVHGLDIAVENPRGSERRGIDPDGKEWAHTMSDHYGYLKRTTGADNEHIDTYVGRNSESEHVFIVDQVDQQTGSFDEHKVMLGFNSQDDAVQAYSSNFDQGWKVGPVRAMSTDEFKTWLKEGDTKKPAGESAQESQPEAALINEGTSPATKQPAVLNDQDIRAAYGDSLESVMADVEMLADDFTIDLHSVVKKKNALKNPNYHAVKYLDGRVEILGMKNPATSEWVGKAPVQDKAPAQGQNIASLDMQIAEPRPNLIERATPRKLRDELIKQRESAESVFEQIQSGSGLIHRIPSKLMDRVHKLGHIVNDLMNAKTDGVKTNVLYGKRLLARIAKLNPDVQVHIVSDLNRIEETAIRANLSAGGFFLPEQNTAYFYLQSNEWRSSAIELVNHELVHAVTAQSINDGLLSEENLNQLREFRDQIDNYRMMNYEDLSENVVDRLNYASSKDFPHELFAVGLSESGVREAIKQALGNSGLQYLDAVFAKISTNQNDGQVNGQDEKYSGKQHGIDRNGSAARGEGGSSQSISKRNNRINQDGKSEAFQNSDSGRVSGSTQREAGRDANNSTRVGGSQDDKRTNADLDKNSQGVTDNTSDKKRFSRAENRVASSTVAQVRDALVSRFGEKTIADLEEQGILNIVQDQQAGMTGSVEGWYENGKVTLVASNLDADSAIATFLHELGGHGGFQNMMNKDAYADLMRQFARMVEQGNPIAVEAKRLAERELNKDVQLDEYLPYMITLASQMQLKNVAQKGAVKRFMDSLISAVKAWLYDKGIKLKLNENDILALAERMVEKQSAITATQRIQQQYQNTAQWMKALNGKPADNSNQVKHAFNNDGSFDGKNKDIRFSRQFNAEEVLLSLSSGIKSMSFKSIKSYAGFKSTDWLGIGLQALGRRQLTEIYSKILPPLSKYNELAAQMDADKNDAGANADALVREWSNLRDENQLAGLMHDATLAKIDPAKPHQMGDSIIKYKQLRNDFNALSPEAQAVYLKARDAYRKHYAKVHQAIKERILRSELSNTKKAELLKDMDNSFFGYVKGVYFPLSRFGKYVVVARSQNGQVESVSRAETMAEAEKARSEMMEKHPLWKVDRVILDKEFNASRDAVGRGFMSSLFSEVNNLGLSGSEQAEFEDTLSQLYLSSMPDLSWAKHGIHRKGTAGFSQDARRAFAQNMFSGANYLAKLHYADQLAEQLDVMQKHATEEAKTNPDYNQPKAQRVIDEMNKRHENLMNPKSHPLSSTLTSVGFIYYLGLSPASAMVNLSQTPLVAYPIMGAKWGFDKAARELLRASNDFRKGVDIHRPEWNGLKTNWYKTVSADISKFLNQDEQRAYKDAVDRGVIDVTQAHDLAGIAQGEDSGVMWKTRPVMRAASTMFHSAERFNREVTFIAAYRLARGAGENHDKAFDQAVDATYKGHFDYSSGNRPRVMQGNTAKVLLLFKQFGQNMIYTLARQTYQSFKAETRAEKIEARKALGAVLAMHAAFAGVLGLPGVWGIMALASAWGGDDDEPWNAEIALRNYLAEAFNPTVSNLIMKGAPRALTPIDMSGRVGINNLLLPDVQEGLEGKRWAESAMAAALGPVAGIGTNIVKGAQEVSEGHNLRGIETMLPVFLRNFVKTYRYGDEGVQDKTGISIMDEVSSMDLLVQGLGFSPSDVRTANEGKSAVYQLNRKLNERRSSLMTLWSRAKMMDDQDEMGSIWDEIQAFNEKNPSRRITRMNLNQSYRSRQRRIDSAEDGIYLSRNRQDAREAGRFAFGE